MDELWSFIGCKQKRVRPTDDPNRGDCYVFVAIERHSKLVLNIAMGKRDQATTDFAQLIKVYKATPEGERRYSPAEVASVETVPVMGRPDPERICTSIVERSNLSTRMGTRRFTRLTNAFSKKWENHWAAVALWLTFYNFCRVHKSLRITPAMAAEIASHVWSVRELLEAA